MKRIAYSVAFMLCAIPGMLTAQTAVVSQAETIRAENQAPALRDQLMPSGAALTVTAPAAEATVEATDKAVNQPAFQRGGSGTGYMIAGAALLVAGLLIEGDAGTLVAVAGAAIGAYGLFLHFR